MTMNDNISVTMDIFFIVSLFYSGLVGTHIQRTLAPACFFFSRDFFFIGVKLSFIAVMRYSNIYEYTVRVKLLAEPLERESTVDIRIYLYIGLLSKSGFEPCSDRHLIIGGAIRGEFNSHFIFLYTYILKFGVELA